MEQDKKLIQHLSLAYIEMDKAKRELKSGNSKRWIILYSTISETTKELSDCIEALSIEIQANELYKEFVQKEALKRLFVPSEEWTTFDEIISSSIDWAIDNHKTEEWSIRDSFKNELIYKFTNFCKAEGSRVIEAIE